MLVERAWHLPRKRQTGPLFAERKEDSDEWATRRCALFLQNKKGHLFPMEKVCRQVGLAHPRSLVDRQSKYLVGRQIGPFLRRGAKGGLRTACPR